LPASDWIEPAYAMLEFVKGDNVAQFSEDAAVLSEILAGS
jgi:hypothetical protein